MEKVCQRMGGTSSLGLPSANSIWHCKIRFQVYTACQYTLPVYFASISIVYYNFYAASFTPANSVPEMRQYSIRPVCSYAAEIKASIPGAASA